MREALRSGGVLSRRVAEGHPANGFLWLAGSGGRVLMVAARPILRSDDGGRPRGYLAVGRLFAGEELAGLEAGTGLTITPYPPRPPVSVARDLPLAELSAPGAVLSRPEGRQAVAGYSYLQAPDGQPVSLLRFSDRRDLYQHGSSAVHFMVVPVIVCGLVLGLFLLFVLEREVLSRIARLGADVAAAGRDETLTRTIALSGDDELTALAAEINDTLGALARSRAKVLEQQEMDRAITESVPLGLMVIDPKCRVLAANPQLRRWFAVPEGATAPLCPEVFGSEAGCGPCATCTALQTYEDGQVHERNWSAPGRDGSTRHYRSLFAPVRDAGGHTRRVLIVLADETYHLQLEAQVRRRAREEAIGRLAGGIAHDFNNLLTVIMSSLTCRLQGPPRASDVAAACQAARQAADLVGQLLAFSRHETPEGSCVQFSDLLRENSDLLRRVIPESIVFETLPAPDLWPVALDPTQAQQVLTNLVTNARDAMPHGGALTISTANLSLAAPLSLEGRTIAVGDWVVLTVADTGVGIGPEIREHIFEPYFSTKESGRGTGLGLPLVAAVIERAGGHIVVQSTPGGGSSFQLYLPRDTRVPSVPEPAAQTPPGPANLAGTVLMAEDNDMVRNVGSEVLQACGLRVLSAANGQEALQRLEAEGSIDLLFTDVVMPGMSGPELAREVQRRHPGVPVLFASGYTDGRLAESELPPCDYSFLPKPYEPSTLLAAITQLLGGARQQQVPSSGED